MVKLYVFEKSTNKVVAVIQGPDAVSCEHMAGHVDEHGQQPYCSESLGWTYRPENNETVLLSIIAQNGQSTVDQVVLLGVEDAPVIEAHPFDPNKPAGSPGGPHRMTQEQFDEQIRRQRAEQEETAARHGLKVKV
jgi:hypothetical protein